MHHRDTAPTDNRRLRKLLAFALDPSASDAEAENAGLRALREARRLGLDAQALAAALAQVPRDDSHIIYCIPPEDMVIPLGRHRGEPLGRVFAEDPAYIRWFVENVTMADPALLNAAWQLLRGDTDYRNVAA